MGTRKREVSQQHRLEKERAAAIEAARTQRKSRGVVLGILVVAAIVAIVVLVMTLGSSGTTAKKSSELNDVASTNASLKGIDQNGFELGDPKAPVTIVEYVDPQCPACRDFFLNEEPKLMEDLVRTGKARLQLKTMAILGADSSRASAAMHAIAEQDLLFNFTAIFYHNQGQENAGYITDKFLDLIAEAAGADLTQLHEDLDANGSDYDTAVLDIVGEARNLGFTGTPSFGIRIGNGDIEPVDGSNGVTAELLIDEVAKATKKAKAADAKSAS